MNEVEQKVIWKPQEGPQTALIQCPVFEVFYGGARGGGKTEGSVGDFLEHANTYGENANGIFLRRTSKQLEEVVARTQALFKPLGATFREQKSEWRFPNGARLKFRYLERDTDAEEYQGHNYTWCGVEEVTNFPSPEPINKMRATLRSSMGVRVRMVLTGNPGGPGHQWVKQRYIDPCKTGFKVLRERFTDPFTKEIRELERVFIPSKLSDNPLLTRNDPMYVARLQQQGSAQLVRAWLDGDWDIVLGAFFDCFDPYRHILSMDWEALIPKGALRFKAFDWGSAKPFCVGWYVVSDGTWGLPKKALLKYREWYGWNGQANVGMKMNAEDVALGIVERERGELVKYGVADPAIFQRDGGPSIAERMSIKKCQFRHGDNKRKVGWDQLRRYLVGDEGTPMLYFLENCDATIRTLPVVQHDEHDTEDVDTDNEDHAVDETRYAVMSRPWLPKSHAIEGVQAPGNYGRIIYPQHPSEMTINELVQKRTKRRKAQQEA